jgi:hypothetical protein
MQSTLDLKDCKYQLMCILAKSYSELDTELYDYLYDKIFHSVTGVKSFKFGDLNKCFVVETSKPFDAKSVIENAFAEFVENRTHDPNSDLIRNDIDNIIPILQENGSLYECAKDCITVLNISPNQTGRYIYQINLYN